jgi:hypothetical protein
VISMSSGQAAVVSGAIAELVGFGRTNWCCRGQAAAGDHLSDFVELARWRQKLRADVTLASCELVEPPAPPRPVEV